MALPGNGIFVLRGEISTLMTAIKRGARWNNLNYQVRMRVSATDYRGCDKR